jgi:hypothetical protein
VLELLGALIVNAPPGHKVPDCFTFKRLHVALVAPTAANRTSCLLGLLLLEELCKYFIRADMFIVCA